MACLDIGSRSVDAFPASLESAQAGSSEALGELLHSCRQYLLLIANREVDGRLAAKVGASDFVQETLLTARREFGDFRGQSLEELFRWLRRILLSHLAMARRRFRDAQKRDLGREVSLDEFCTSKAEGMAADTSSPSSHLVRSETEELLAEAVERLPERYREVIHLRHWERLPFEEVARRLGISSDAARQVWARAIKRLNGELRALDPRRSWISAK